MSTVVGIKDVVDALEMVNNDFTGFLNPETGEIRFVSDEDHRWIEEEEEEGTLRKLPEWQQKALPLVKEVLQSDKWLTLPSRFEIHEWSIMERFALVATTESLREQLLGAIHGRGAFRMFKERVRELGVESKWHAFREAALTEIARSWLESHGVKYC
jgi:hypothetical protein